ncbi:alpha/beta fold hydrolase [Leisingera sp. McT4-56]|uniref:alpha/beta fold hydrolase n=1 Tax=Leisingera sp. McT4-56 TaxID=2881255 RepID=UPI001CF8446E|nr:alpha/beta hydrolase [Leisingera sp. McT4-56]MCB4454284.1 alpha/beta hydrolase [Leisingera sp. McT4-56]
MLVWAGLAVAAGAALTSWQAGRREAAAIASHPPQGQILVVGSHRVHVVEMGRPKGSAPDLVLIHGSSGNTRDMTFRLAPALADDFRILIFDRPGLGYSSPLNGSGATIRQQADVLRQAAAQMGAETPVVLGQSYGGAVALAWAVDHPQSVAALVSVAGVSHPWDTPLDLFYRVTSTRLGSALAVPAVTAYVSRATVMETLDAVFAPQAVPEGYASHFGIGLTLRRASLRANAKQRANLLDEVISLAPHYDRISIPVEIIHGTADDTVNPDIHARQLVRDVPTADLTLLEGIGHMPHHVATDEVAAAIHRAAARANLS